MASLSCWLLTLHGSTCTRDTTKDWIPLANKLDSTKILRDIEFMASPKASHIWLAVVKLFFFKIELMNSL